MISANQAAATGNQATATRFGWLAIFRLGLVQAALGAVVVLATSTLNRVMVVEYALPATLPGVLVALHYAVQMIRPRFGYGSDRGGRQTPWIIGGMAILCLGGVLCAAATLLMSSHFVWAVPFAVGAYATVGLGVGAAGTSLLVLLAKQVDDRRRAAAATIMWVLMIAGFAVTSTIIGHFLDPFSPRRLIEVIGAAATVAFLLALGAVWRVEQPGAAQHLVAEDTHAAEPVRSLSFSESLRRVWSEPQARAFTLFVFISMLAYSAQELLLEPFCGLVFGFTLGDTAKLSGLWHGGVLIGMIGVGAACSGSRRFGSLRVWTIGGCCASAVGILGLACAGLIGPSWPLRATIVTLGMANGVFAVSAIGSMMELAHKGEAGSAGVRMGLWGAAQALAFALGGLCATGIVDSVRFVSGSSTAAFAAVFSLESALYFIAARFAFRIEARSARRSSPSTTTAVTA